MRNTSYLHIPSPCHENWSEMTATEKGKFCSSCRKEVIDFTSKSPTEISRLISTSNTSLCGRFTNKQLHTPLVQKDPINKFSSLISIAASTLLTLSISNKIAATTTANQTTIKSSYSINDTIESNTQIHNGDSLITIEGTVIDMDTQEPLPFCALFIEEYAIGTTTDYDGNFKIDVPFKKEVEYFHIKLNYVGYTTLLQKFVNSSSNTVIKLTASTDLMGEVVIVKKRPWWRGVLKSN